MIRARDLWMFVTWALNIRHVDMDTAIRWCRFGLGNSLERAIVRDFHRWQKSQQKTQHV